MPFWAGESFQWLPFRLWLTMQRLYFYGAETSRQPSVPLEFTPARSASASGSAPKTKPQVSRPHHFFAAFSSLCTSCSESARMFSAQWRTSAQ